MNRSQLENLYIVNGLDDFRLKNTDDLIKVHGIDCEKIDGYYSLDNMNKSIFKKFIINLFNSWGMEERINLNPLGIYWVKEVNHLSKENPDDDYFINVKTIIYSINKNDTNSILHKFLHKEYKYLKILEEEFKFYLRFEYETQFGKEWLHVIKEGTEWY